MSVRTKGDKIGMWLGDANVGESIITVGKRTKERLNIENQVSKKEFFGILFVSSLGNPMSKRTKECLNIEN